MSDVGGILGLWIGFSILTIFEFIELGMDYLIFGIHRLMNWPRGGTQPIQVKPKGPENPNPKASDDPFNTSAAKPAAKPKPKSRSRGTITPSLTPRSLATPSNVDLSESKPKAPLLKRPSGLVGAGPNGGYMGNRVPYINKRGSEDQMSSAYPSPDSFRRDMPAVESALQYPTGHQTAISPPDEFYKTRPF